MSNRAYSFSSKSLAQLVDNAEVITYDTKYYYFRVDAQSESARTFPGTVILFDPSTVEIRVKRDFVHTAFLSYVSKFGIEVYNDRGALLYNDKTPF